MEIADRPSGGGREGESAMLDGTRLTIDLATVANADAVGELLLTRLPSGTMDGLRSAGSVGDADAVLRDPSSWRTAEWEAMRALASQCGLDGFLEDIASTHSVGDMLCDPACAGMTTEGVAYVRYTDGDATLAMRIQGTAVAVVNHDAKKDHGWEFLPALVGTAEAA
jgi:hypothetical protein